MSVTFSPETSALEFPTDSTCPACKGTARYNEGAEPDMDCPKCMGYGGNTAAEENYFDQKSLVDGEFNVANGNAAFILRDVLGTDGEPYGSMDADLVLLKVSAFTDAQSGVLETVTHERGVIVDEEGVRPSLTVINCGRTLRQVQSYLDRLADLAVICQSRGEKVTWG